MHNIRKILRRNEKKIAQIARQRTERIYAHASKKGDTEIPLRNVTDEEIKKAYLLFCSSYEQFKGKAHDFGLDYSEEEFLEGIFYACGLAAFFEKVGFNKKGRVVDIGGPTRLFTEALAILGFEGTYVPVNIDKQQFNKEAKELYTELYPEFRFEPLLADAMSFAPKIKENTCDLLLYNHVVDDIFEDLIYKKYAYNTKKQDRVPIMFKEAWKNTKKFDEADGDFWEYLGENNNEQNYIGWFIRETLNEVTHEVRNTCKILRMSKFFKTGGLLLIVHYPPHLDGYSLIKWCNEILPKLVDQLTEFDNFNLEASSQEGTFLHPWFLLSRK